MSTHVRESGFWNERKILLVESGIGEFLLVESWIQVKESGIPLTIGIRYPSSTDKVRNPVPKIRNPRRRIQNPRLSWIPLYYMGRYLVTQNSCVKIAEEAANNINKYRPADIRTADDPRSHPTVAAGEACSVALVAILPVLILGAEVALLVSAEAWKLALTIRL